MRRKRNCIVVVINIKIFISASSGLAWLLSEIGAEPGGGRYFDLNDDAISLRLRWRDYTMANDL